MALVEDKRSGRWLGQIGLNELPAGPGRTKVEVGWDLDPSVWGQRGWPPRAPGPRSTSTHSTHMPERIQYRPASHHLQVEPNGATADTEEYPPCNRLAGSAAVSTTDSPWWSSPR